ncbi:Zinc finger protein [Armadillidium vulgare]|nr:Zinc finger protein [Armadillidium vulgare]
MKTNTKEIYKFVCDECGYKANNKSKLTRHKLTHKETLEKEFQCDHCEYKANRKDRLQVHIHTKHKTGLVFVKIYYNHQTQLKKNILASVFHHAATDKYPFHQLCPKGPDSWCKFQNNIYNEVDIMQ